MCPVRSSGVIAALVEVTRDRGQRIVDEDGDDFRAYSFIRA